LRIKDASVVVTGGASGLGRAAAQALCELGGSVTVVDLAASDGANAAADLPSRAQFVPTDVTDEDAVAHAIDRATEFGPIRAIIHAAGRGGSLRVVNRDGSPGELATFQSIQDVNVTGTFNVLRYGAAAMSRNEVTDDDGRGVVVLTASVAAYEGQIGQIAYAASKGAVVGMTLTAARDLSSKAIRVCAIAPGIINTPMLKNVSAAVQERLSETVPYPHRPGFPEEYGQLATLIITNPYLNGETIRLDGAMRLGYR
jgi:NAD(P)-dependent dehydrogenase (short-subunit alcohol dehydrogenase family)